MKVLLDTNIVLDLLLDREEFGILAKEIFIKIESQKIEGFLCPTTIITIYYLLSKHLNKNSSNRAIESLLEIFNIVKVDKKVLIESLQNNETDFEDSVIYTSAKFANIDIIVTRDEKGFKNSKIKVLHPSEFLLLTKEKKKEKN